MCFFCMIFLLHSPFTAGTTGCVGRTYIALSVSVGAWLMIANPKIVTISTISCVGHFICLLFTLAVSVFYSVFVVIYTTSFAGRYLSFLLTLCLCGSCLASLLLFMIFPTSRLGWVNLLTACDLLFVLVLLCVTLHCNGLFWSLLSCFVLYVFSTMYLGLLILFAGFHNWSYRF